MNTGNKTYAFVVRLHHHRDGGVIGKKVGNTFSSKASVLGGIILVLIGIEIFVTGVF